MLVGESDLDDLKIRRENLFKEGVIIDVEAVYRMSISFISWRVQSTLVIRSRFKRSSGLNACKSVGDG